MGPTRPDLNSPLMTPARLPLWLVVGPVVIEVGPIVNGHGSVPSRAPERLERTGRSASRGREIGHGVGVRGTVGRRAGVEEGEIVEGAALGGGVLVVAVVTLGKQNGRGQRGGRKS